MYEEQDPHGHRHQPGLGAPRLRTAHALSRPAAAAQAHRHAGQPGARVEAGAPVGRRGRGDRRRAGARQRRPGRARRGAGADAGRSGQAVAADHRRAAGRHPAGMGGAPRAGRSRPLLRQRARAVLQRHSQPQAGADDVGVHRKPALCRPAAATGRAQAARLARRAAALRQRHAPGRRLGAVAACAAGAAGAVVAAGAAPGAAQGQRGRRPGA